jgi:hypothetical protein
VRKNEGKPMKNQGRVMENKEKVRKPCPRQKKNKARKKNPKKNRTQCNVILRVVQMQPESEAHLLLLHVPGDTPLK